MLSFWQKGFIAALVALLVLILAVLPAEFGIDVTGAGRYLGITKLHSATVVPSHANQTEPFVSDQVSFELTPFASVEYKYVMAQGQSLVYHWQADGELVFDLHSEADGSNPEDAQSYQKGRQTQASGSYTAPYTGIHGWFWENRQDANVVVTLSSIGYMQGAIVYGDGTSHPQPLTSWVALP